MKSFKQYYLSINEKLSLYKISKHNLEKLFKNEPIKISNVIINVGDNIYEYDLIQLSQGAVINIENSSIRLKLDDNIEFKDIRNIIRKSPLNEYGSLFDLFMNTHPMKKGIL